MGEPSGFYKLEGQNFIRYVSELSVTLGRNPPSATHVQVGDDKLISRKHAVIEWNAELRNFTIVCIGRNPIMVNRLPLANGDPKQTLSSKTPIRIGEVCFYFLVAVV